MAWPDLFGRICRVVVGPAGQSGRSWVVTPEGGLRMGFSVRKTGDAAPNTLESLRIYNLSADSQQYIDSYDPKTWVVQFEAGYVETGYRQLFRGALELASNKKTGETNHRHQGPDWLTEIHGKDGVHEYRSTVVTKAFAPNTSASSVVHSIANALGVPKGTIKGLPSTPFAHGYSVCGPASAALTRLCTSYGLRWSIQDGVLQILPAGDTTAESAFLIGPETGLVGSPERTETGVKFTSLLQGAINPGRLIQLNSAYLKGLYVAESVEHQGDTWDQPWYTIVDCLRVK